MMSFKHLKVGDTVLRSLAGIPMKMVVSEIKEHTLVCQALQEDGSVFKGDWEFDRETGAEEDHDLGWGVKFGVTGSYLTDQPLLN
jgi:hypothetical protein